MTNGRGVSVTGIGGVCALGHQLDEIWDAAITGRPGIVLHSFGGGDFGPPAAVFPVAKVSPGSLDAVEAACRDTIASQLDSFARFALFSAREALADAGIELANGAEDVAVIFGHSTNGTATLEDSYERFFGKRSARLHPLTIPRAMVSSGASAIAMVLGIRGPVFATSSACASSGHAIAQAAAMIRSGQVEMAIVGGSESIATPGMMRCWQAMQAMSATTCRPFSLSRDGMVLGEGGAALILEATSRAEQRGARIYAHLVGEGQTSDAGDLTRPTLGGR